LSENVKINSQIYEFLVYSEKLEVPVGLPDTPIGSGNGLFSPRVGSFAMDSETKTHKNRKININEYQPLLLDNIDNAMLLDTGLEIYKSE
jgi:hypothetical protein